MKRKLKQWIAVLCLLMLLAASLHLARAESAPTQEECAPYRIVLTAPGGWNRSNSAIITVSVKDEQNLGWYQMAYRMNDGDWTDCEQLFDKSKAEIAVHENGTFTFRITDPHGHTFEESTRVAVIDRSAPTVKASISGTTLQVEVQDDLSGVAGSTACFSPRRQGAPFGLRWMIRWRGMTHCPFALSTMPETSLSLCCSIIPVTKMPCG